MFKRQHFQKNKHYKIKLFKNNKISFFNYLTENSIQLRYEISEAPYPCES